MKWRKVKKNFKKIKHTLIGQLICATDKDDNRIFMKTVDVSIRPAGGNKVAYDFKAEPWEPPVRQQPEQVPGDKGFELNFDMPMTKENKKSIKKLIEQI